MEYSFIHLSNSCFVGIFGVLSTESKSDLCDTTNCFEGSNEDKRLQQNQDSSHSETSTREGRKAATASLL